ncbi:MAG: hypothetical protein BGO29_13560 [Bacteroidales bacterium 36-12]|nr:MAG: hypothetical protein BGO29_13560 [Bacteroidales bacterium 36-12]
MNRYSFLSLFLMFLAINLIGAQNIKIKTGIEVLKQQNFKILEGKRVGLITNPTGVDNVMKSTIDVLHDAKNVNLVALFAPEHGVRGDAHAGDYVEDEKDTKTGLPVYSLHGKTRKATPEMLKNIDVLVYDIQDIGCRSFTYISTMGLAMEAAAENNIEFVVLDRPNPLGGLKVEGGPVEKKFISFVSQYNIPYVYGLTCGELALFLNGENMIAKKCNLHVVTMKGWKRNMRYEDTGLQWISSSPHIPHPTTALFYPVSGILGELGYLSIGVGYPLPFELFAAEWIDAEKLAENMNRLKLSGLYFRPVYFKPFYATGQGKQMKGVQVHIINYEKAKLSEVQFYIMQEIASLYPDKAVFDNANQQRFNMFDKVCGSDNVRLNFSKNNKFDDIRELWNKDVNAFVRKAKKYWKY